jgi:hypothetical protein
VTTHHAPRDLPLSCRCGTVRGIAHRVSPETGNHVVCYCDDCQAFARFLGRDRELLDARGGAEIFQVSQGEIELTHGVDHVACVRLTPKGLVRWYASCCDTPIGNTVATRQVPFIGVVREFLPGPVADEVLGPVCAYVHTRFATGGSPPPERSMPEWRSVLRVLGMTLRWRLRGDHHRSPFFDATGDLRVPPRVLTRAERDALR